MKKLLPFILILFVQMNAFAQNKEKYHLQQLSEEVLKYYKEGRNCWDNTTDSCLPFFKKMVKEANNRKECISCAKIELARMYFFESNLDSCQLIIKDVLAETPKLDNRLQLELEQDSYNLLGSIYSNKGEFQKSINSFSESRKRIDKLGNKEQSALNKVNMGVVYYHMENFPKAVQLQKQALRELQNLGVTKQTAMIASNIASFYTNLNKPDSVLYWSDKTIEMSKEQGDVSSEIAGYYLKASSFEESNSDSALIYVNKSIDMAEKNQNLRFLGTSYQVKANVLAEKGYYQEAKLYYEKSLENFEKIGNVSYFDEIYKQLGLIAYENKDYLTASKYLKEYAILKDSLISEENRMLLHDLNTKYETEKKEKQIAEQELKIQKQNTNLWLAILGGVLLATILGGIYYFNRKNHRTKLAQLQKEKENAILNSFIQGEERERNRISHELHDGVAAMIGAAKMSLESLPHLPPEKQQEHLAKIKSILENTHADVRHIAHNLLPTVLEKDGIIKATIHFAKEINETKLVQVSVQDDNSKANELNPQLQLMLFRVIQELINNIIKHSQAQNAQILFSRNENGLHIEVTDDGIGFDGEIDSGNQGLYSISQRIKSIGGNFKFTKKKDRGMQAIAELKVD